ncbi:DUF1648 domain-containing protein [Cellulosimicrobium marinum]|uniref:DUF1648 domain-containing protein n=1 Tax=Cellulosimicrobium marinum TaxID=1638992 RepID=UPI001E5B780E|nr:DUF1648 domain-containing protein [Cellulosimicrobium marinum]MCB7137002.1 DUF1648 domain-containing protein [Cellulosimicrobium marinum]
MPTTTPRPARTYETDALTRLVRLLSWAGRGVVVAVAVALAVRADDQVPVHVDAAGNPDRFGSPLEGALAVVVLVACAALCLGLSPFPRAFNYPLTITEDNAQAVYREGERMLVWTGAGCLVLAAGATATIFTDGGPFAVLIGVGVALVLGACVVGIWRTVRAGRTSHAAARSRH